MIGRRLRQRTGLDPQVRSASPEQAPGAARSRSRRVALSVVALAGVLIASTGCTAQDIHLSDWPRWGWPRGITPQAVRMEQLWQLSTVAALVVGVFTWALIFWCVFRYKRKGDDLPMQVRYNLPIEVLYSVVPLLIVFVLFFYTAVDESYINKERPNPDVQVSVVAFKWNWKFAYPEQRDAKGQPVSTVGSSDEVPILVLPTGKRIRFVETSDDVIHSFWVPSFLFKRDVIPGRANSFEITSIDKSGAFVGRCAEFCGTYHSEMNFEVRAVSPPDFERYLAARKQGDTTAQALTSIGQNPYSTTTKPFDTSRTANKADAATNLSGRIG